MTISNMLLMLDRGFIYRRFEGEKRSLFFFLL